MKRAITYSTKIRTLATLEVFLTSMVGIYDVLLLPGGTLKYNERAVQSSRILKPLSAIMLVYVGIRSRNLQSSANALSLILPVVYATDVKIIVEFGAIQIRNFKVL